jgi:hypothetical protein
MSTPSARIASQDSTAHTVAYSRIQLMFRQDVIAEYVIIDAVNGCMMTYMNCTRS